MSKYKELNTENDKVLSNVKDNITIRVFNKDNLPFNVGLEDIPHKKFLDLIITFALEFKTYFEQQKGYKYSVITNKDLENWNIDEEILDMLARRNMEKFNSYRIENFTEHVMRSHVLYPILQMNENTKLPISLSAKPGKVENGFFGNEQYGDFPLFNISQKSINDEESLEKGEDILIISNRHKCFASSYMTFQPVLTEVYNEFKENFYICPFSVHELICIKESFVLSKSKSIREGEEDLLDMIEQINDKLLKKEEEILSYNIYYHCAQDYCTMLIK